MWLPCLPTFTPYIPGTGTVSVLIVHRKQSCIPHYRPTGTSARDVRSALWGVVCLQILTFDPVALTPQTKATEGRKYYLCGWIMVISMG